MAINIIKNTFFNSDIFNDFLMNLINFETKSETFSTNVSVLFNILSIESGPVSTLDSFLTFLNTFLPSSPVISSASISF